jgi:hypothetical protein
MIVAAISRQIRAMTPQMNLVWSRNRIPNSGCILGVVLFGRLFVRSFGPQSDDTVSDEYVFILTPYLLLGS